MKQSVSLVSATPDAEKLIMYCARVSNPINQHSEDTKLLTYCIRHGHWSPFEMAHAVFEISTTRAIAAQILRHRSFSFQEFSQRYSVVDLTCGTPDFDMRLAGTTNRQSSIPVDWSTASEGQRMVLKQAQEVVQKSCETYANLIEAGFAAETARNILPLCTPTKLYMAGNIRSWIHYVLLRTKPDTQQEHRDIAFRIMAELCKLVPVTMVAVEKYQQDK
jgi:thymidylate synthase (FAD)